MRTFEIFLRVGGKFNVVFDGEVYLFDGVIYEPHQMGISCQAEALSKLRDNLAGGSGKKLSRDELLNICKALKDIGVF